MMSGAPYLVYPPGMLPEDPYLPYSPDFLAYQAQRGLNPGAMGGGGGAPEVVPRFRKGPQEDDIIGDPYYDPNTDPALLGIRR